jgi:hypothetical protein
VRIHRVLIGGVEVKREITFSRRPTQPKSGRPRCGAKRRDGGRCEAPAVWDEQRNRPLHGGRCRLHGGLSTGPRSAAGRAAIAVSNRRRAAARVPAEPAEPGGQRARGGGISTLRCRLGPACCWVARPVRRLRVLRVLRHTQKTGRAELTSRGDRSRHNRVPHVEHVPRRATRPLLRVTVRVSFSRRRSRQRTQNASPSEAGGDNSSSCRRV